MITNTKDYKENLIKAIETITAIEDEIYEKLQTQEDIDKRESDLLHYIEENMLSTSGCYAIVKELRKVLRERRVNKQLKEIYKTHGENKAKIGSRENRQFLIAEINKKYKSLQTQYNFKYYEEEFLDKLAKKKKEVKNED